MKWFAKHKALLFGIAAGSLTAIATLLLTNSEVFSVLEAFDFLLMLGLVLSMAASGNVHAFSLWFSRHGDIWPSGSCYVG